jgi:hypothetical protein
MAHPVHRDHQRYASPVYPAIHHPAGTAVEIGLPPLFIFIRNARGGNV